MAFCDGTCVLTLDTAAAVNAEASFPYKGGLASPVGLLRVSDTPGAPGAPEDGALQVTTDCLNGGSLKEGSGSGAMGVHSIVRRMLTATHFTPQHRRWGLCRAIRGVRDENKAVGQPASCTWP